MKYDTSLSGTVLEHAGDIYFSVGDQSKALDYWQQAAKAGNDSKLLKKKIEQKKYIKK